MADRRPDQQPDLFHGLITDPALRQEYIESGWLVSIPLTIVPAHWLSVGEQRLDGSFYSQEAVAAQRVVNDCGFESARLDRLVANLYILGRFKRIYATDKKSGWAYLSASDSLDFRPVSDEWIAKDHAPKDADRHFAKQGWLLISSSGSVGRLVIVTKRLEKFFLTHDLIRVVPADQMPIGYLYAFLSTWIGQALLAKDQYGSAIKHLEPHHVASVPIPLLPRKTQMDIHENIMRAYALREEANNLLDNANEFLYGELGLPSFDENLVPYLKAPKQNNAPELPHPKAFSVKMSELEERLDGSYHVPTAKIAIETMKHGKYPPVPLRELLIDIRLPNRFKRIYVQQEYGVPFLQASHLPMMRPYDLKYISKRANEKNIESCLVFPGDILLSRSGTVGRTSLISVHLNGWAASEHLLRLIADTTRANPGYIVAFLTTPYGQHQILSKIYGGVVDEITPEDTRRVWIPNAPLSVQEKIGALVIEAFEKKDHAALIEEATVKNLEQILISESPIS